MSHRSSRRGPSAVCVLAVALVVSESHAATVNWVASQGTWFTAQNWNPAAVPNNVAGASYDVRIGIGIAPGSANVNLTGALGPTTITSLGISNGSILATDGLQLNIAATTLISADSELRGVGVVEFGNADGVTSRTLINDGKIDVVSTVGGTRTLRALSVDRLDLDGDGENGFLIAANSYPDVDQDSLSLIIDGELADAFSGTIQLGSRDRIAFLRDAAFDGAVFQSFGVANAPSRINGTGRVDVSNSTFTIAGPAVIENEIAFVGTGNTIALSGSGTSLTLAGTTSIADASALTLAAGTTLIVTGETAIRETTGNLDWDGSGSARTTISGNGRLTLDVNRVDSSDNTFNGQLTLNDEADLSVNVAATSWSTLGPLTKNNAGTSTISGDALVVSAAMNVNAGTLELPTTTFASTSAVTINGTAILGADSVFAGASSIGGTGTLRVSGSSSVTSNTTVNTAHFDWDGETAGSTHTINNGAVFTVNAVTWGTPGNAEMNDAITVGGSGGQLIVNTASSWTMRRALTTNPTKTGTTTIGGTARLVFDGTDALLHAKGNTTLATPVTLGPASSAVVDATLNIGANLTLDGATVAGPGTINLQGSRTLTGHGTISATVAGTLSAAVRADDGVLELAGPIGVIGTLGTADDDGVLAFTNAVSTTTLGNLDLQGGELRGPGVTIAHGNGITGRGLVSAKLINNSRIHAITGTLVVATANHDNDWDGTTNSGVLSAASGRVLELRDNATSAFAGTVDIAPSGELFANGFSLDFEPASTLSLAASTFRSTHATTIRGQVTIAAGNESRIDIGNDAALTFASGSSTTLNADLRVANGRTRVSSGATFGGVGKLVIPADRELVIDADATIAAGVIVDGRLLPGGSNGTATVSLGSLGLGSTATLFIDVGGLGMPHNDRISVNGFATLDGLLDVTFGGAVVPAAGQTFTFLTAGAISGTFDNVSTRGLPTGLSPEIRYFADRVELVLNGVAVASGDFDADGDLDANDINQLFSVADGAVTGANARFDVNGDGLIRSTVGVAGSDADAWVVGLKGTRYGDADLDRQVGFNDLLSLAQHYNAAGGWAEGNFDGEGGVAFNDLLLLAANYAFAGATDTSLLTAEFAADWALAQSLVPEPSIACVGLIAALQRRRRAWQ